MEKCTTYYGFAFNVESVATCKFVMVLGVFLLSADLTLKKQNSHIRTACISLCSSFHFYTGIKLDHNLLVL